MLFQMKISYLLDEAVPAHHHPAFHLHIQSCCIAVFVSSNLFGIDWIHMMQAHFLSLGFLNNNYLRISLSVISIYQSKWKHFPHICFVKSERLVEVGGGQKGTFMPQYIPLVTNSRTHTHTHTHRQLLPLWPLECCAVLQIELKRDFTMTFESSTHAT